MVAIARSGVGSLIGVVFILATSATGQQNQIPRSQQLRANGLELGWYTQVSMDPSRDRLRDIGFDGKHLYAQSSRGVIHAIAADGPAPPPAAQNAQAQFATRRVRPPAGGQTVWISQVGRAELPSNRPAANSADLFVVAGSELFVLNKHTGKQLWHARLPSSPSAPLAASDEFAYLGFIDGQLRVYDVRNRTHAWFYRSGRSITVPALPIQDVVAFASQNGILYVAAAGSRRIHFQYETDFPVTAALANQGDFIYMASEDFKVYCLHLRTGLTRWVTPLGNPISKPLVVVDDDLFVVPDGGGLFKLNGTSGARLWSAPEVVEFVAASPSRVYATGISGRLVVLDRDTGQRVGLVDTRSFPHVVNNSIDDRIYVGSPTGLLLCLHETALPQPVLHEKPSQADTQPSEATAPAQ